MQKSGAVRRFEYVVLYIYNPYAWFCVCLTDRILGPGYIPYTGFAYQVERELKL